MSKLIRQLNYMVTKIFYFKSTLEFGKIITRSNLCNLFEMGNDNNDLLYGFYFTFIYQGRTFFMQQRTCNLRNVLTHMLHRPHGHPISANLTESEIAQIKTRK